MVTSEKPRPQIRMWSPRRLICAIALTAALVPAICMGGSQAGPSLILSWARTHGAIERWDEARAVAVDSNNNLIVTGTVNYISDPNLSYQADYVTIKYSPAGNVLWMKTYDSGNLDQGRDAAVDSLDNIIVTGAVEGPTAGSQNRN